MTTATGTFEVSMEPLGKGENIDGVSYGSYTNRKTFSGDLQGTSRGTMLTAMTPTEDLAGYVLIEQVEGTLHGKRGSFALQHSSTMTRGKQRQNISVVPDSGAGELQGLAGTMIVEVSADGHRYVFQYELEK